MMCWIKVAVFLMVAAVPSAADAEFINIVVSIVNNSRNGTASDGASSTYINSGSGSDSVSVGLTSASSSNSLDMSVANSTALMINALATASASAGATGSAGASGIAEERISFGVRTTGMYLLSGALTSGGTGGGMSSSFTSNASVSLRSLNSSGGSGFTFSSTPTPVLLLAGATYVMEARSTTSVLAGASRSATGFATSFVSLTAVPEPSTVVMTGTGLLVALGLTRKRRVPGFGS